MKTLMITGASGFLGRAIVDLLAEEGKYRVVAVTSGRREVNFPVGVEVEGVNLLEESAREALMNKIKPDILLHFAWPQEGANYRSSPQNLIWLEASSSLLRHFARNQGKQIIFAGSSTEYGGFSGKMQENNHLSPNSLYGTSKELFGTLMEVFCAKEHIPYIHARIFTVYGEGDTHAFGAIPETIGKFIRNEPVTCKEPQAMKDYIYIKDAALAITNMVDSKIEGRVNIASGYPRKVGDIFSFMAQYMGKEHLLTLNDSKNCPFILVGDTSILDTLIDRESFLPFEKGLSQTIDWWKSEFEKSK